MLLEKKMQIEINSNLNLITRGLIWQSSWRLRIAVDNKFKVKSFGADEFLKAD